MTHTHSQLAELLVGGFWLAMGWICFKCLNDALGKAVCKKGRIFSFIAAIFLFVGLAILMGHVLLVTGAVR